MKELFGASSGKLRTRASVSCERFEFGKLFSGKVGWNAFTPRVARGLYLVAGDEETQVRCGDSGLVAGHQQHAPGIFRDAASRVSTPRRMELAMPSPHWPLMTGSASPS